MRPSKSNRKIRRQIIPIKCKAWWKKYRFTLIITLISLAAGSIAITLTKQPLTKCSESELFLYVLDVGQGDAALLYSPDTAVLIDGGEYDNGERILDLLRALGIQRLDAVINSHPHSDHLGGLCTVLNEIPTDVVYLPRYPEELTPTGFLFEQFLETAEEKTLRLTTPVSGQSVSVGSLGLTFYQANLDTYEDLNDCSLVCRITHGDQSFLFTGDISKEAEHALIRDGYSEQANFLKCPHHGSGNSASDEFLDVVSPDFVSISAGTFNDYGHPAQACLKRLLSHTNEIYRTDLDGTILFISDGTSIRPQTHISFD